MECGGLPPPQIPRFPSLPFLPRFKGGPHTALKAALRTSGIGGLWSAQAMLAPSLYEAVLRSPRKRFRSRPVRSMASDREGWSMAPALQDVRHRVAMDPPGREQEVSPHSKVVLGTGGRLRGGSGSKAKNHTFTSCHSGAKRRISRRRKAGTYAAAKLAPSRQGGTLRFAPE